MEESKRELARARWRRWAERNRESEAERARQWRKNNPEQVRDYQRNYYHESGGKTVHSKRRRDAARKKNYGITPERFEALLASQGGKCAVCRTPEPRGKATWHLDHDHETGAVRGVLCITCNIALGMLHDDPARCRAAADYLDFAQLLR